MMYCLVEGTLLVAYGITLYRANKHNDTVLYQMSSAIGISAIIISLAEVYTNSFLWNH